MDGFRAAERIDGNAVCGACVGGGDSRSRAKGVVEAKGLVHKLREERRCGPHEDREVEENLIQCA
jgi:hypothetical protein